MLHIAQGICFNWTIEKRREKKSALSPLLMFIAGLFNGPSWGAADVLDAEAEITAPCRRGKNTHLIPARKVITACWNIKPDGLPLRGGSRKHQQEKFRVWEKPLSLLRECKKKKILWTNCYPTDWFLGSMTLIHFCDMFSAPIFFPGFYCLRGSAHPKLCDAGSYCDQTGLEVPAGHCAAGYYCPKGSSEANATLCPRGHYCPLGTPLPLPCPPGTIKSEPECYFIVLLSQTYY